MPSLAQSNDQLINVTSSSYSLSCTNGFWSKHGDDITYDQLQKFWSELSLQARQDLLRIDKQTLFEHARKDMYCSRCNGLLLEVFLKIVGDRKSLQQEIAGRNLSLYQVGVLKDQINTEPSEDSACQDEVEDPSVHPWGGITTTRDGALTLSDCYLYSKSLKGLQKVFDSARARERERELDFPDACGGGARGWISQGMVSYARAYGTRESCALHNARLCCDTLEDFWSVVSEETRFSLMRMKEDDFIERIMYRFDVKRFCRECRKNVIREFKELKELKRTRRVPRCTKWFCVADTAFQYEVSNNTIHADWNDAFADSVGKYQYFEWAAGTGAGKSDILDYENVGMSGSVQVNGLDLGGLKACYITLRAWKADERFTELSVKAHALNGEPCVHCRLMVGDGYVSFSHGESIRRFFEHAEEAEEEDDSLMDMDEYELNDQCARPQKHAKTPELAREFLLKASTVIFKEQVEKVFKEGTARQNARGILVCLALKLMEERILVACKEIGTLEKQVKLLEEEENEKREEERKQRKRAKEREKKLRRKERLRGKVKANKSSDSNEPSLLPDICDEVSTPCITQEPDDSTDERVETSPNDYNSGLQSYGSEEEIIIGEEDENNSFHSMHQTEFQLNSSGRRADQYCNESTEWFSGRNRQSRSSPKKFTFRSCGPRFTHKLDCTSNRRSDPHYFGCNGGNNDYKTRFNRDEGSCNKIDSPPDQLKPIQRFNRSKLPNHIKKVWEPVRYPRCSSDSDVTLKAGDEISSCKVTNNSPKPSCNFEQPLEEENDPCLARSCKSSGSPDFSASSSSSSDNCSSCLSEGDSNAASPTSAIQEPSSTSDSEEERETVFSQVPQETVQIKVTDMAASKTVSPPIMGPLQQTLVPQIINYPFQPPPMTAYYPQTQLVPWSTGLEPYVQGKPDLFTPFNYCVPYNPVQHLNTGESVYQPLPPVQTATSQNHAPPSVDNYNQRAKDLDSEPGFSLFKYFGPVARANTTLNAENKCSDGGVSGGSNKHTDFKEYKLFGDNGINFSLAHLFSHPGTTTTYHKY